MNFEEKEELLLDIYNKGYQNGNEQGTLSGYNKGAHDMYLHLYEKLVKTFGESVANKLYIDFFEKEQKFDELNEQEEINMLLEIIEPYLIYSESSQSYQLKENIPVEIKEAKEEYDILTKKQLVN